MDAGPLANIIFTSDRTKSNVKLAFCMLFIPFFVYSLDSSCLFGHTKGHVAWYKQCNFPTFTRILRDLGTGARTSATFTAASSRNSGVGGYLQLPFLRSSSCCRLCCHFGDILHPSRFLASDLNEKKETRLLVLVGLMCLRLKCFDIPTTNYVFNSRRFWRKFDIRVSMQMHGRGRYCLMNITC